VKETRISETNVASRPLLDQTSYLPKALAFQSYSYCSEFNRLDIFFLTLIAAAGYKIIVTDGDNGDLKRGNSCGDKIINHLALNQPSLFANIEQANYTASV
jgi:hypothetical protein